MRLMPASRARITSVRPRTSGTRKSPTARPACGTAAPGIYARYTKREGLDDFFGNIQFSLIPAGDGDGAANTITHLLVYLVTKQDDEDATAVAAELITIASEPRINTLHAIKSSHLGIAKSQSSVDLYAGDRWAREATERLLPYASAMPNNVNFGQYWEIMWDGLESAWTGQKTPAEAVANTSQPSSRQRSATTSSSSRVPPRVWADANDRLCSTQQR